MAGVPERRGAKSEVLEKTAQVGQDVQLRFQGFLAIGGDPYVKEDVSLYFIPRGANQVQRSDCYVLSADPPRFDHLCRSVAGASGGPLVSHQRGVVVGLHQGVNFDLGRGLASDLSEIDWDFRESR